MLRCLLLVVDGLVESGNEQLTFCFVLFFFCDLGGREIALNPDPLNLPKLDPKDAFLLSDTSSSAGITTNAGNLNGSSPSMTHVPWLRKTEYISREGVLRTSSQEMYVCFFILDQNQA